MRESYDVLVVDDDPISSYVTVNLFKRVREAGLVLTACTGTGALETLRGLKGEGRQPQLLVLDISLPRMSGLEVLEELERAGLLPDTTQIILLTSSSLRKHREMAAFYRVDYYIQKPLTEEKLREALDRGEGGETTPPEAR